MKKRILILTLLLTISVLALPGCGRTDSNLAPGSTQNSSAVQSGSTTQSDSTAQSGSAAQSDSAAQSGSAAQSDSAAQYAARLTLEEARRSALERVPGATESNIRIHLEMDDRMQVYDGEINYNQKEYDFEIDAETGEFLEWTEENVEYFD